MKTVVLDVLYPYPEYEKNGSFVPLQEVDASSEVIGEVTMLNTLKHYKVRHGWGGVVTGVVVLSTSLQQQFDQLVGLMESCRGGVAQHIINIC